MTQHLRKLIMSFAVSAFLFGALSVQTNAQELNTIWERTARTGATEALPSWFEAGSIRGMAYGTVNGNDRIYAADRGNTTIQVMDAATGADVTPGTAFDLSGVSGGTLAMNDIEVSDDGVIFLGNLAAADKPFRLYWWTTEGGAYADSVTIPVSGRAGDKFTVVGSLADNTIEVWLPVASVDPGVVYVATTADQGATWAVETITLSGTNTVLGSSVDAAPLALGRTSDFYVGGNSSAPARYTSTGEYVTGSALASASRNGMEAFKLDDKDHLAVYTYRPDPAGTGDKTGMVYVYDVSDAASPTIVGESPLMGDDADTYSSIHGEAEVVINEDGTYNVYALEGVNGFATYTNAVPAYLGAATDKVFFSEYIEGSSNNRALEIYNGTDSTVTLKNYRIAQAFGGAYANFHLFKEGATIEAGGTYVLINSDTDTELFDHSGADEVLSYNNASSPTPFDNPTHFTGKKALALIHVNPVTNDTTWTDVFGELTDSDTGWAVSGIESGTINHTLVRKPSVTTGNSTPLGSFGTKFSDSEWIVKPQNFYANLDSPSADLFEALAGDYFVPQREDDAQGFGSLAEALYFLNESGLMTATTFYITDDLTETSGLAIDRDDFTESVTLTIKPAAGVTPTLDVVSNGGDGFAIIQADYVTIDGSNTMDGDTRDLTITSSDEGISNMLWTKETVNTTIKNIILTYTGAKNSVTGIATNESGAKATDGLSIINSTIGSENGDFRTAVGVFGYTNNEVTNTSVIGNRIHASYRGIAHWRANNNTMIGNTLSIDSPRENESRFAAIYLALNDGNTIISGNEIVGLKVNRSETAGYAAGILFNASLGTVDITNNAIAIDNFENIGAATDNQVFGIAFDNAAGNSINSIYHNTVRIGSSEETGTHAAFGPVKHNTTGMFWDLKNNIFEVNQDAANASAIHWPIENSDNLIADFNNYYVSGATANVGFYNATGADLDGWKTASGEDENTTNVEVEFVSDTDSRLAGLSIGDGNLAGTALATVTVDFDGATRNPIAPYKGAFEGSIALAEEIEIGAFALLTPDNSSVIDLTGDSTTVVEFSWEAAASESDVTYMIHLDSLNGDFSKPLFSTESDSNGFKTSSAPTFADLDEMLEELEVAQGASIELKWTVVATAGDSSRFASAANTITLSRLLGVGTESEIEKPQAFSLSQNYPNPFNPTSNIRFTLPQANNVRLDVYNINGQLVQTLVNSRMNAGEHTVQFDAGSLASGVYIYRIISGNFVQSKKMTLIK